MRRIAADVALNSPQSLDDSALRLRLRRCGCTIGAWAVWLGRLKGRSSILGHYSGPDALGVRAFRLGGCRESGWYANGCPSRKRAGPPAALRAPLEVGGAAALRP